MAKKLQEAISWHPDAKARGLQIELQKWMETYELSGDTKWWTADEFYSGKHVDFDEPPHLVLTFEGDLHRVIYGPPDLPRIDWYRERRKEFDAIVERHRYWYEIEDNVTMCFMPTDD